MAAGVGNEDKGMMERLGDVMKGITTFPDTSEPPGFLKDYIEVDTWRKTMRVVFSVLVIIAGALLTHFMASANPAVYSVALVGAGVVLCGFGANYLVQDITRLIRHFKPDFLDKKSGHNAIKVMSLFIPVCLIGGSVTLIGASVPSLVAGYGFGAYFSAGMILFPLGLVSVKIPYRLWTEDKVTVIQRRVNRPPEIERNNKGIPHSRPADGTDPFDAIRPLD